MAAPETRGELNLPGYGRRADRVDEGRDAVVHIAGEPDGVALEPSPA